MPTAVEHITQANSYLVGRVMIGSHGVPLSQMTLPQLQGGRSLKLVHRRGPASSLLVSAMVNKSILPKVEINTPTGVVTLTNAQILKSGISLPKHGTGRPGGERNDTNELEEFDLTFQKIIYTNISKGGKSSKDDWTPTT
jgi:type VI protein secretion system component Hcp